MPGSKGRPDLRPLRRLARDCGVQTAYTDALGCRRVASAEALVAVLRGLGEQLDTAQDAAEALRARKRRAWGRLVPPVVTSWPRRRGRIEIRLPGSELDGRARLHVETEDGAASSIEFRPRDLPVASAEGVDGREQVAVVLPLSGAPLPHGYHRFCVECGARTGRGLVVSAPRRTWDDDGRDRRTWGTFLPLYALHSRRSHGIGDYADLRQLVDWCRERGGGVVGTLPLLASFLDRPCDPSPYAPVSRLFWNELYLAVEEIPELASCAEARAMLGSEDYRSECALLRAEAEVDYARVMVHKRRLLERLARSFFRDGSPERRQSLELFSSRRPEVADYARFRAAVEKSGSTWRGWSAGARDGSLSDDDYDQETYLYHVYVQWQCAAQIAATSAHARGIGGGLYLDLPLGVHADGYDIWRERDAFVDGMTAGAPPDGLFTAGQNWGFPPLHPERCRLDGHRYFRACLANHLRHAALLRIDHVMSMHRLFWVPRGFDAPQGVYVHYPAKELYAMLTLESHRHRSRIVGEDLGTVPSYVRAAMRDHGLHRLYVMQFAFQADSERAAEPAVRGTVSGMNTHDTPTFAGFWRGVDIADRVDLGLLDDEGASGELEWRGDLRRALSDYLRRRGLIGEGRQIDEGSLLAACLSWLAESDTEVVLVNLEDLWLEARPQNVPGTSFERPNWKRKAVCGLDDIRHAPRIEEVLADLDRRRRHSGETS